MPTRRDGGTATISTWTTPVEHNVSWAPSTQATRAVTSVAFADDIALVIVGKYLEDLSNLFSVSFKKY